MLDKSVDELEVEIEEISDNPKELRTSTSRP
jgi:hypothetical protein